MPEAKQAKTLSKAKSIPQAKPEAKPVKRRSRVAADIFEGLEEIKESFKPDGPKLSARYVRIDFPVPEFNSSSIKALRETVEASQAIFAKLLGVGLSTVTSWEQDKRVPSMMARRFLAEIARDPDYWKARLASVIVVK